MDHIMIKERRKLILAFIKDIFFASKVEAAAKELGYEVQWIERGEQVAPPDPDAPSLQLAERLEGQGAALLDEITRSHPALLVFDLNNREVPWENWMAVIKSAPATRRIPILAFGSHVDSATLEAARSAGADKVVPRSQFSKHLPDLIETYARLLDYEAIANACQEELSELAIKGLEEFNRGEYFESHEDLEYAWNEDHSEARDLYRAILQVAVAYLHIERGNFRGAMKMFLRVRQWIDPLPDTCRGVNIARLREDAYRVHDVLVNLGPEHIDQLDRNLLKSVEYKLPGQDA
jgi:predicted metal-dependent hydrolase